MGNTLFDYCTENGKYTVFGLPATEELNGREARLPDGSAVRFGDELAVKCDDDLFLADAAGRLLLVQEFPDESLKALEAVRTAADAAALPEALEGWKTDLSFASGCVLTAVFGNGTLTLSPSPEPVVANPFSPGGTPAAPKAPETPPAPPVTFSLKAAEIGEKWFLLHFPETGETVFLNARRFLLYAILRGRIVTGFVEIPPKE